LNGSRKNNIDRDSRSSSNDSEVVDERLKNIDPKMIETVMNEVNFTFFSLHSTHSQMPDYGTITIRGMG
jgi:NADPH-dependent 7-cyano-7-deazaguanine reductase QueF